MKSKYIIDDNQVKIWSNTIGKYCPTNDIITLVDSYHELEKENQQLQKALWEAEESYIYERYEWSFEIEEELEELKKRFERRYWREEDEYD